MIRFPKSTPIKGISVHWKEKFGLEMCRAESLASLGKKKKKKQDQTSRCLFSTFFFFFLNSIFTSVLQPFRLFSGVEATIPNGWSGKHYLWFRAGKLNQRVRTGRQLLYGKCKWFCDCWAKSASGNQKCRRKYIRNQSRALATHCAFILERSNFFRCAGRFAEVQFPVFIWSFHSVCCVPIK